MELHLAPSPAGGPLDANIFLLPDDAPLFPQRFMSGLWCSCSFSLTDLSRAFLHTRADPTPPVGQMFVLLMPEVFTFIVTLCKHAQMRSESSSWMKISSVWLPGNRRGLSSESRPWRGEQADGSRFPCVFQVCSRCLPGLLQVCSRCEMPVACLSQRLVPHLCSCLFRFSIPSSFWSGILAAGSGCTRLSDGAAFTSK